MKWNLAAAAGAAMMMAFAVPAAQADSISSIENARAKERSGYYLATATPTTTVTTAPTCFTDRPATTNRMGIDSGA